MAHVFLVDLALSILSDSNLTTTPFLFTSSINPFYCLINFLICLSFVSLLLYLQKKEKKASWCRFLCLYKINSINITIFIINMVILVIFIIDMIRYMCLCAQSPSYVWLIVTPRTPLSLEFSQQEYWNGLPFPPAGSLPDLRIQHPSPASLTLHIAGRIFTAEPRRKLG